MPKQFESRDQRKAGQEADLAGVSVGPPMAAALEIRICSNRKAPTGMMPVRECRRRKRNERP